MESPVHVHCDKELGIRYFAFILMEHKKQE